MQVYQEPSGSNANAFASSMAGYTIGKPGVVQFTSQQQQQQMQQPLSYPPPVYQPPPNSYGYNPSFASPLAQHETPVGYGVAPTSYGYPTGPADNQPQLQNNQNVQVNFGNATASPPVIIAQLVPVVTSPPSYLGWSIFNFLCCFWPLGLAAIIYSVKVGSARNHEEAKSYSFAARNLNITATAIAPILVIVVVGAVVGIGARTSSSASSSLYPQPAAAPSASSSLSTASNYYSSAYYYSYGYYYYYTYLMYYTYYNSYSYSINQFDLFGTLYSYTVYGYMSVSASQYATDFYYQYALGVYYYG